ncbi:hypothetical protein B0J11DRAFT_446597 [Dendryphion nanum]|uniref:BTB domain-containing protein n=1 Tax=Dendryphion nanum TaxID=256645 RepID=A0A9P9I9A3_9PLEO|nr:hypothetical protein B0J11DRAFT_446597 [Dendryphion nanum]
MDSPNVELMSALASLFECGKYSDLTIVCGMKRYSVHRAIVCSRSEFFDGACRNPFKESETGVIDLTEEDPEAVEHMVNYFYHLDYLTKPLSRCSSQRSTRQASPMSQRAAAHRPAKKFSLSMIEDPLLAMVTASTATGALVTPPAEEPSQFDSMDAPQKLPDTPMADQFEQNPFDGLQQEPEADVEKPHLMTHVAVYALGEKYGIPGLKSLARKKFAHQIEHHLSSTEFAESCQEAYETTVDSDRGLRDVIIQTFRAHPNLSLRKDVELVVRDTPGLAFELFRMASGLPVYS